MKYKTSSVPKELCSGKFQDITLHGIDLKLFISQCFIIRSLHTNNFYLAIFLEDRRPEF